MTYEYLCTACGHAWEAEQSISAAPLTSCPHCHTENAKRQISGGAGFILKGGGWYSDLYSSAPKKSGDESKSEGTKPSSEASAAKSADASAKSSDKGSSGSSGSSSSGSTGSTPTSDTSGGSKAAGAPSGA